MHLDRHLIFRGYPVLPDHWLVLGGGRDSGAPVFRRALNVGTSGLPFDCAVEDRLVTVMGLARGTFAHREVSRIGATGTVYTRMRCPRFRSGVPALEVGRHPSGPGRSCLPKTRRGLAILPSQSIFQGFDESPSRWNMPTWLGHCGIEGFARWRCRMCRHDRGIRDPVAVVKLRPEFMDESCGRHLLVR